MYRAAVWSAKGSACTPRNARFAVVAVTATGLAGGRSEKVRRRHFQGQQVCGDAAKPAAKPSNPIRGLIIALLLAKRHRLFRSVRPPE